MIHRFNLKRYIVGVVVLLCVESFLCFFAMPIIFQVALRYDTEFFKKFCICVGIIQIPLLVWIGFSSSTNMKEAEKLQEVLTEKIQKEREIFWIYIGNCVMYLTSFGVEYYAVKAKFSFPQLGMAKKNHYILFKDIKTLTVSKNAKGVISIITIDNKTHNYLFGEEVATDFEHTFHKVVRLMQENQQ